MKTAQVYSANKKDEFTSAMRESLMLPCNSSGKTTSASIAEKSNVWAEHKLCEKKSVLDRKLYKSIVKINADKLQIVDELSKLRKSASTGALELMNISKDAKHSQQTETGSTSMVKSASKTSLQSPYTSRKKISGATLSSSRKTTTLLKDTDSVSSISITLGGDSSEDEQNEDEGCIQGHSHEHKHALSLTSCPLGRECSVNRASLRTFENATKRFRRQLSPKARNGK